MKWMCLWNAALLMVVASCSPEPGFTYRSPSGRFQVRFSEARDIGEATLDSYYSIQDNHAPDHPFATSISGAVPPENGRLFWSPTERNLVIPEVVPEEVGYRRSINLVRIRPEKHDFDQHLIYMRPLEKRHFNGKRTQVVSVTDEGVLFQVENSRFIRELSYKSLLDVGDVYPNDEIVDLEPNKEGE